jgi:nitrate reductase alpha subunit
VNCTGSCSWKVYVKDGIITWESQQTDYPSVGPDSPEYEPRGCPRGAAFSWYTYSPTRVRFPYARGVLVEMYREAKARLGDPVLAFADIVGNPERRRRYQQARGKGGLVRVSWQEAIEIAAAAHVNTVKAYGPDRCAGFSPIPAMSMVSHAVGTRFIQLIGGVMTSFYDWYADLPVASPQVFGDQTDVPESGDWWDAGYLMMWGSNVPVTRTPDAHWMAEVRYRGTKVVTVSPDYADNTKFADEWLPAQAGTDAALAMAMGHVMLKEFFVEREVPFFSDYVRQYTDHFWSGWNGATTVPSRRRNSSPPRISWPSPGPRTQRSAPCCSTRRPAAPPCPTAPWGSATPAAARANGTWTSRGSSPRCRCARSPGKAPRSCCRASRTPAGPAAC